MKANTRKLTDGINAKAHRPENGGFIEQYSAIVPVSGNVCRNHREPVTLRLYSKTGSRWTCCIWVNGKKGSGSGSGSAAGYGYHKPSAAAQAAIAAAGIELSEPISGRGASMIEEAVEAIARAITGKRQIIIHRAHA